MASHEFRTSVGGSVVDHSDRRPGIITIPNHRWQALLQQVAGVEIQDDDIYGWGWQFVADFQLDLRDGFLNGNWVSMLEWNFARVNYLAAAAGLFPPPAAEAPLKL